MADIFKYACNVRDINHRYQMVHDEIFALSVRKLFTAKITDHRISIEKHENELKTLQVKLMDIETALDSLPQSELKIRRGKEILLTLSDYITALAKSINYLQKICNDKINLANSDSDLVNDTKAYDDAIQHHKALGIRLNDLLSSF